MRIDHLRSATIRKRLELYNAVVYREGCIAYIKKRMMEIITLRFQTPQDFQGFRKVIKEAIVSHNVADLEVVCQCDIKQIATAITQFGGLVIEPKK